MKVLGLFLIVLVAGASAGVYPVGKQIQGIDNSIIDDALEIYKCLMEAIPALQNSVNQLISVVTGVTGVIDSIKGSIDDCLAIGGDNPSIIDQIQQATCILGLIDVIRDTVNQVVNDVQGSVAEVINAGNNLIGCFQN